MIELGPHEWGVEIRESKGAPSTNPLTARLS
jgi:hypothetical protein